MKCECRYFVSAGSDGVTAVIYDSYVDQIYWNKQLFPPALMDWLKNYYDTNIVPALELEDDIFFSYDDLEPVLEQHEYETETFINHEDIEMLQKELHKKLVKLMEEHECGMEKDNAGD